MAIKNVFVDMRGHPLSREEAGVTFDVKDGSAKYGELIVSKGGIRWRQRGKRDHHHATWEALDRFMRDQPKK